MADESMAEERKISGERENESEQTKEEMKTIYFDNEGGVHYGRKLNDIMLEGFRKKGIMEVPYIGYLYWSELEDNGEGKQEVLDHKVRHYILTDGTGVTTRVVKGENQELSDEPGLEIYQPGEFKVINSVGDFGSRGGMWIEPIRSEVE